MADEIGRDVMDLLHARNDYLRAIARSKERIAELDAKVTRLLVEDVGRARVSFRYGDDIYRIRPKVRRVWRRDANMTEFFEWVAAAPERVRRLFNPNTIRWGQLKEVATEAWLDADPETGEIYPDGWEALCRTHIDYEEDAEYGVDVIPMDRAPKFLQALNESEMVPR